MAPHRRTDTPAVTTRNPIYTTRRDSVGRNTRWAPPRHVAHTSIMETGATPGHRQIRSSRPAPCAQARDVRHGATVQLSRFDPATRGARRVPTDDAREILISIAHTRQPVHAGRSQIVCLVAARGGLRLVISVPATACRLRCLISWSVAVEDGPEPRDLYAVDPVASIRHGRSQNRQPDRYRASP
jgi:hypothetical protein